MIFVSMNCDQKTGSEGEFDHIIVFSDSTLFVQINPLLEQVFDQFIYTPHTERSFLFKWRPLHLLDSYKKRRNILFISTLDGNDFVSEYINKMLSPEVQDKIKDREIFEIFVDDIFCLDQVGIILCAANENQLKQNLETNSQKIFDRLEEYHFQRLNSVIYSEDEQYDLEDYLSKNFGWKLRVPYSYQIVTESSDGNFIWLKRPDPGRNIFVYRFKADSSAIAENRIINLRDSLSAVYFEDDSVLVEDTYTVQTKFLNYPALKLVGVWQNHNLILGGPFRTYTFYDPITSYVYIIDFSVLAPGKRKKPYLDQLEVIVQTFEFTPNSRD